MYEQLAFKNGLAITLTGPQGCGKSVVAEKIKAMLSNPAVMESLGFLTLGEIKHLTDIDK